MRSDALIVGAGPAGLYAAQQLARAGLSVQVLEEHEEIGEPVHCTGIVGAEAFALPGVPTDPVLAQPRVARFYSPDGHALEYPAEDGNVWVVDRGAFDRGLAERAREAGATIRTGTRVMDLEATPRGVVAHARHGGQGRMLSADVAVLACGASYRIQRTLGWGMPPLFLGSAQTELASDDTQCLSVFLRQDVAPTGFGWLVPIQRAGERRAKVGVMGASGARRALGRLVGELTASGGIRGLPGPLVTRLLPLGPLARTHGNRVLAIGDAAGLVKPTTGGGIYYSLLSARWATDVLLAAFGRGDFSGGTLAGYEDTWRTNLGRELRVGMWFRRLAAWLTPNDLDDLTRLAITDGVMPVIRAAARFNWHQDLILKAIRHPGVLQIVLRRLLDVVVERGWGAQEVPPPRAAG
jgi:geranylgeranyl reductase family protein